MKMEKVRIVKTGKSMEIVGERRKSEEK